MTKTNAHNSHKNNIEASKIDTTILHFDNEAEDELEQSASVSFSDVHPIPLNTIPSIFFRIAGGRDLAFRQHNMITVGREDRSRQIQPTLDLKHYFGYELGVSRYHAQIVYYQSDYHVIDLGSANGTKVNGKKLKPNIMYPIYENDEICFGLFPLTVRQILHSIS